jgi:flagellar biosynthesis protein FlhB
MQVDLDEHIPPELYRAVAELLAFIHYLESGAEEGLLKPIDVVQPDAAKTAGNS